MKVIFYLNKNIMGFKTIHSHKSTISFWEHDCSQCSFLGSWVDPDDKELKYDLYWCIKQGAPTVVARFGDAPEDNLSGCGFTTPSLVEAERRALMHHLPLSKGGVAVDWYNF